MLESQARGLFTILRKQHASNFKQTSHYYKTCIFKHIYYTLFLSHGNTSLCRGQKRPIFRGEFGIICHYFFLLSSSPWQRWQVLVLFMTPNINDLLLYLCLFFFLLDSNLCVPYAYIHVFLKCAFACYKKKPNLIECLRCWTNKLTVFGFIYCFILILYLTVFQQITAVSNNLWIVV